MLFIIRFFIVIYQQLKASFDIVFASRLAFDIPVPQSVAVAQTCVGFIHSFRDRKYI